jgi:hypothetical protein
MTDPLLFSVGLPDGDQLTTDGDTYSTSLAQDFAPKTPVVTMRVGRSVIPIGVVGYHVQE